MSGAGVGTIHAEPARPVLSMRARVTLYLLGFAGLLVAGLNLFLVHPVVDAATGDIGFQYTVFVTPAEGQAPNVMPLSNYLGLVAALLLGTGLCWFATWRAAFLAWTGRIAAGIPLLLFLYAWIGFAADAGLIG